MSRACPGQNASCFSERASLYLKHWDIPVSLGVGNPRRENLAIKNGGQNRQGRKETKGSTEGDSESAKGLQDRGIGETQKDARQLAGRQGPGAALNLEPPGCRGELLCTQTPRGTNQASGFRAHLHMHCTPQGALPPGATSVLNTTVVEGFPQ